MRAVVVYESMFGNTREIAEAIGEGLSTATPPYEVTVVRVGEFHAPVLDGIQLLVVGGPTHAWSMSRPSTRRGAETQADKPGAAMRLEPGATGPGLREWFPKLAAAPGNAVAFDTRSQLPRLLTGRAGPKIQHALRRHGFQMVARPESFLVTKKNTLVEGEQERARQWGRRLANEGSDR